MAHKLKKLAAFILSIQISLGPAYGAPLATDENHKIMPAVQIREEGQVAVLNKNMTADLVTKNEPAAATQNMHFELGPGFEGFFDLSLNETKKTIQVKSGNFTYNGTYNALGQSAEVTFLDQPSLKAKSNFYFSKNKNGGLYVSTFSLTIQYANKTVNESHNYSEDGKTLAVNRDVIENGITQHISIGMGAGNISVTFSVMDSKAKKTDLYIGQADEATRQQLMVMGFDMTALGEGTKKFATKKISLDFSNGWEITQSTKTLNGWDMKYKMILRNGVNSSYIVTNGKDLLMQQNQALEGFPGYQVSYAPTKENDMSSDFALIFTSGSTRVVVSNFPGNQEVTLNNKKYVIELNAQGKISLRDDEAYPGQRVDVNHDGVLNDDDVDVLSGKINSQVYDAGFDLNHDGKLDSADMKVLSDRYVKLLQETTMVLIVDPSSTDQQSFKNILAAQERARDLIKNGMTKDINILITKGTYYDVNLQFDGRDSGKNGYNVIYRGYPGQEMPQLVGGSLLESSRWVAAPEMGADVYRVNISGQVPANFNLDVLFVNGEAIKKADSVSEGWKGISGPPEQSTAINVVPGATMSYELEWQTNFVLVKTVVLSEAKILSEDKYPISVNYVKTGNTVTSTIVSYYSFDGKTKIGEETFGGKKDIAQIVALQKAKGMKAMTISSYDQVQLKAGEWPANFDWQNADVYLWSCVFVENKVKVLNYDPVTRVLTLDTTMYLPIQKKLSANGTYTFDSTLEYRISIANSKSFLSENEFLYDKNGNIFFKAKTGTKITDYSIVLPKNVQAITVGGTIEAPVHNIIFDRLDISGGASINRYVSTFLTLDQFDTDPHVAALLLQNTKNITIKNSYVHNTGGIGISIVGFSENNIVTHNRVAFTGADGIVLNGDDVPLALYDTNYRPRFLSQNNVISYNDVHDTGLVFEKADGIHIVQSSNNDISYNTVHGVGYCGIFLVGMQDLTMIQRAFTWVPWPGPNDPDYDRRWQWNYTNNNKVSYNDISDILRYADDGGAFYSHSAGKNTEVSYNKIHDVLSDHSKFQGGYDTHAAYGIYLDGGQSDYFNIHHNLVDVNVNHVVAVTMNGAYNRFTNNTLVSDQESQLIQLLDGDRPVGNEIEHNIFVDTNPKAATLAIFSMYTGVRYSHGDPIPAGSIKLYNSTADVDPVWLLTPRKTVTKSDNNIFYAASGGGTSPNYGVIATWFGWGSTYDASGHLSLTVYRVPVSKWQTNLGPGIPYGFDQHSSFAQMPIFRDPANGDYSLVGPASLLNLGAGAL